MFGVVFIAGFLFGTLSQTRNAMDNRHPLQAFLFVVFGIYFVWFWAKGQTLAMKTWHIRVVDAAGQPLTQARALGRYVLALGARNHRLADRLGGGMGSFEPLSSTAAVLARRFGRHPAGAFRAR